MVVLKKQDLPRSDETRVFENLGEIKENPATARGHFQNLTYPSKHLKLLCADITDACGMARYIESTRRGCLRPSYVSENGSAGPDFLDLWGN